MNLTPLQQRIVDALQAAPGKTLHYHQLATMLWPYDTCPKAWRYSSNGGPHGWAMPLGRALRQLRSAGIAYEKYEDAGRGDVVLLTVPNAGGKPRE